MIAMVSMAVKSKDDVELDNHADSLWAVFFLIHSKCEPIGRASVRGMDVLRWQFTELHR